MSRRRTPSALLVALLAIALVAGPGQVADARTASDPGTAVAARAAGAPGAAGIGDPYFPEDGNGGIDVVHYAIHDRYGLSSGRLRGRTVLTLRATQDLSRFDLDLLLPVSAVGVDGAAAAYSRPDRHELRIVPAHPLLTGQTARVVVHYDGHPAALGWRGERNWLADRHEVVAMNEPHMASWWFASDDHPSDKATYDVSITAARHLTVVGNGLRVAHRVHGRLATTHWRETAPMATYLAFFAVGRYATRHGTLHGRPWLVAVSRQVDRATRGAALATLSRSARVTAWLESQVGPYPFESTGGLGTSLPVGFALENQTRPTYPASALGGNVSLIVHELAHQWFGDSVSVHRWRDVWLNEGFATFMQVRYDETHGGPSGATWLRQAYDGLKPDKPFWKLRVQDPGAGSLFDSAIYERGAMTLQALRTVIGDSDFWSLLRTWAATHAGGTGSTKQFEALARSISGQDLTAFFAAWLHDRHIPADIAANGLG